MNEILKKLTSRKFLSAAAGVAVGVLMIFGLDGHVITEVAGAVMACSSVVTYIKTEGKIDAAAVELAQNAGQEIKEAGQAIADSPADDTPLLK